MLLLHEGEGPKKLLPILLLKARERSLCLRAGTYKLAFMQGQPAALFEQEVVVRRYEWLPRRRALIHRKRGTDSMNGKPVALRVHKLNIIERQIVGAGRVRQKFDIAEFYIPANAGQHAHE